ncbi:hypothetical protein HQQ80_12135 [Microbacteriaceae bacterium VKM Ac-2855]|nr:hypothetical protein [Microbacteriaceae bacterium VKM Ac-2855]
MSLFAHRTRPTVWTSDERDALAEAVAEDRAEAWRAVGSLDRTVVATLQDPSDTGAPRWPSLHQYFLRIARGSSVIVASDGLSDPFDAVEDPGVGWGCELCLESTALARVPATELWNNWQFQLLYGTAQSVAHFAIDVPARLNEQSVVPMEVWGVPAPAGWIGARGAVGVALGLTSPGLPREMAIATGSIRLVTVTPLWPREYDAILAGADAVTDRLRALPADELLHPARPDLA